MTPLRPVPVYHLYPFQIEQLGYDLRHMNQYDFMCFAEIVEQTFDGQDLRTLFSEAARQHGIPVRPG